MEIKVSNDGGRRVAQFTQDRSPENFDVMEIGALNRPTYDPSFSRMKFADYLSQDDLIAKFAKYDYFDTKGIVPVDFVVQGIDYRSALSGETFDLVLASHVIEHVPDLLGWVDNVSSVLRPHGILSLIVPDKRFTFDLYRSETTWSDVLSYNLVRTERPDLRRVLDHLALMVEVDAQKLWSNSDQKYDSKLIHTLQQSYDIAKRVQDSGEYFDVHCSVFSPHGFLEAFKHICRLKWPLLLINSFFTTHFGEIDFFVSFKKMPDETDPFLVAEENYQRALRFQEALSPQVVKRQE